MRVLVAVIALLLPVSGAIAEIVTLNDGTQIEGKIHKTTDGWTITKSDGAVVSVTADKVNSIAVGSSNGPISVAEDRLQSLRRVADHSVDVQDIINRYQKFIAQSGDLNVTAEAQNDLAIWQARQDKGMVKVGDQWMTVEERQQRRANADLEAAPAKDMIANYRYKDAAKVLDQAILDDPQSAPALYLRGVLLYKTDQVAQSKKSFEAVNALIPDHAPTLNNLAVIAWRQKSFVIAMSYYDQAMMSAPSAKEILDNVAEALNVVPSANQAAPVVLQAVKLFAEQDAALQKLAATQGMFRWGATWVNATQLQELKAAEARVKQQLDALQQQMDAIQQKLNQIDSEIAQNQIIMDRLSAQSVIITRDGAQIQMPPPDQYYQLKSDNDSLAKSKQPLLQQQDDLRSKAKDIQAQIPVPKFTGTQQIIGVDGTPVHDPGGGREASEGATTAPSPAGN